MIKNYFQIAIRSISRNKFFTLINILGLSIGMAVCLLIFQYVAYELSYDNFHKNGENIYRVGFESYSDGKLQFRSAPNVPALGPAMKNEFPEVLEFVRFNPNWDGATVIYRDPILNIDVSNREEKVFSVDPSFLSVFSFPLIIGDRKTALNEPNTLIISEKVAEKYFGKKDPLNKTLKIFNEEHKITGVFKNVPTNSHIKFDILMSMTSWPQGRLKSWTYDDFYTYVLLKPNSNPDVLKEKIPQFINKYKPDLEFKLILQPLKDIHLYSALQTELEENGIGIMVYFLTLIAILILIIAWINYFNLTTTKFIDKTRETGIRKVSGATRIHVLQRFLSESILINLISIVVAFNLVVLLQSYFYNLIGKPIPSIFLTNPVLAWSIIILFFIGAVLSGLYPAMILSSFKPVFILKGALNQPEKDSILKKNLIIIQFAASIVLIAGSLLIGKQISFMTDYNLGIQIDKVLVLRGPQNTDSLYVRNYDSFKAELLSYPEISNISASTYVPGKEIDWTQPIRKKTDFPDKLTRVYNCGIDENFINTYELKIIEGRNFLKNYSSDYETMLFTREAVKALGFESPENALNQEVKYGRGGNYKIIGIVEDYHHLSLKNKPGPVIFRYYNDNSEFFSVKINSKNLSETINRIESKWHQFFPGNPFEFFFLDDFFNKQYKQEKQFARIFKLFTFLSIFIACLGLFGLSSYNTVQRTKEIGIRKTMGANLLSILGLLLKGFIKLILISIVIGLPIAYIIMNKWLNNFPYKIEIGFWFFIIPALTIIIIAILTTSYQSIKTAIANPIKALRYE